MATKLRSNSATKIRSRRVLAGRYQLLSMIATGGMGEVWKARDRVTGKLFAAKILHPELCGEEISLSRIRLEAKNAGVIHHPNVAEIYDSGEENGQGWIIMELVLGSALSDHIGNGNSITPTEAVPILLQIAYALDATRRAEIVHRDIKPANILIRPDGMVKLTDFGISTSRDQVDLTAVGMVMGTAQYLSPEQALGRQTNHLSDLYSLGVIAFEALVGFRPFSGKSHVDIALAHVRDPIPKLPKEIPESLKQLVTSLLAKDPSARPRSALEVARQLTAIAKELNVNPNTQVPASFFNKNTKAKKNLKSSNKRKSQDPDSKANYTLSHSIELGQLTGSTRISLGKSKVLATDEIYVPKDHERLDDTFLGEMTGMTSFSTSVPISVLAKDSPGQSQVRAEATPTGPFFISRQGFSEVLSTGRINQLNAFNYVYDKYQTEETAESSGKSTPKARKKTLALTASLFAGIFALVSLIVIIL